MTCEIMCITHDCSNCSLCNADDQTLQENAMLRDAILSKSKRGIYESDNYRNPRKREDYSL